MPITLSISWQTRADPLAPIAAAAKGRAAQALGKRLLASAPGSREPLMGVVSGDILIVLAGADDLPWVDGICYLGRNPEAPSLLLPTNLAPSAAPSLLERAVMRGISSSTPPLAVLPFWRPRTYVISAGASLPIDVNRLERWLRGEPL